MTETDTIGINGKSCVMLRSAPSFVRSHHELLVGVDLGQRYGDDGALGILRESLDEAGLACRYDTATGNTVARHESGWQAGEIGRLVGSTAHPIPSR